MADRVVPVDRATWDKESGRFLDRNYRQCWAYSAASAERLGARSEHVAVIDGSEPLGLAEVRIKRVPLLHAGIAYVSGGPLVRKGREDDRARLDRCLEALRGEFVERRGFVLRIHPAPSDAAWNAVHVNALRGSGFEKSARDRDYRTIMIDLSPDLERLRRDLAQKWRNCLNKAERSEVSLQFSENGSLFPAFSGLFAELIGRKGFDVELGVSFYARVQEGLNKDEQLRVAIAYVDQAPVAGQVSSLLGDTCVYLLGASNDLGRAVNASYLLQWKTVCAAKERRQRWYDLGGIAPEDNPGVYRFKSGMGGSQIVIEGPFESVPRGLRGSIAKGAEDVYRWFQGRRSATSARDVGPGPRPTETPSPPESPEALQ